MSDSTRYSKQDIVTTSIQACLDEAYSEGYEKGRADISQDDLQKAYTRGLNDAWNAANTIAELPIGDLVAAGFDDEDLERDEGEYYFSAQVIRSYTANEAVELVKKYEEKLKAEEEKKKQEEAEHRHTCKWCKAEPGSNDPEMYYRCSSPNRLSCKCEECNSYEPKEDKAFYVGDEVITKYNAMGVITSGSTSEDCVNVLFSDGSSLVMKKSDLKKTYRNYGDISHILGQLQAEASLLR